MRTVLIWIRANCLIGFLRTKEVVVTMATIVKRTSKAGKTSYLVRIRIKGQPPQNATFKKLAEAKLWATQTEAAITEGRYFKTLAAKRHTLKDLLTRYIADVLPHKTAHNQAKEAQQLAFWEAQLGAYPLAEIAPALIAEGRDQLLAKGLAHSTVNRYLAPLSHAFTVAEKEYGWLQENPVKKVRRCKENNGRLRDLSQQEVKRLLQACRESTNPYLYTIVVLALSTGMRKSEIMHLTWRMVDLINGRIVLAHTKNKERRALPLQGEAKKLLVALSEEKEHEDDLLFSGRGDRPIYLQRDWKAALIKAEIEAFHFHDLRHTAASYLAMAGVDMLTIADILGHKTLSMVKRYAHLSDGHKSNALERLDEVLNQAEN
jgi:integrase